MRPFESGMANDMADYAGCRDQRGFAQQAIYRPVIAVGR